MGTQARTFFANKPPFPSGKQLKHYFFLTINHHLKGGKVGSDVLNERDNMGIADVLVSGVSNKTSLDRGTAATPLLCLAHEKVSTPFSPFKWWFVLVWPYLMQHEWHWCAHYHKCY